MKEKLIEYWLDSIGERGYQAAFLQMLIGEGHTIVHSTRHTPIEFGKDVVSLDASGIPCAFQLKGNPGSRLTLSQFREIRDQIIELIELPILFPTRLPDPHKCFLVTNGEVEEEVQVAINLINTDLERRGFHPNQRLHLISRGQLLAWAIEHSGNFWPEDFSIHENVIRMYNIDGREQPDLERINDGLDKILGITVKRKDTRKPAFTRSMIAAALYVSMITRNYLNSENHNAIIAAWTSLIAMYTCALERYDYSLVGDSLKVYEAARASLLNAMIGLLEEIHTSLNSLDERSDVVYDKNVIFLQGGIADRVLWNARALKVAAIFSILELEDRDRESDFVLTNDQRDTVRRLFPEKPSFFELWGEGAIPQLMAFIFAWRTRDPSNQPDTAYAPILRHIIRLNLSSADASIPSPYLSLDDCLRSKLSGIVPASRDYVDEETQRHSSYFAEGLLHCFVRGNYKSTVKSIWPDLTRLHLNYFRPDRRWQFGIWRLDEGTNISRQLPSRYEWNNLQEDAADVCCSIVPKQLEKDPVILLAFLIFFPHRAAPEVLRYLHFQFSNTWFLPMDRPKRFSGDRFFF